MKVKIRIQTPKGHASKTEKRLRPFLLGKKKAHAIYVNDDDTELYWEIEGTPRELLKIQTNVARFDTLVKMMMNTKSVRKAIRAKLSTDDQEQLRKMLYDQTSVEVLKEATAQEMTESGQSFWDRVKSKFKKKPVD